MKKHFLFSLLLFITSPIFSAKHIVTSDSDNITTPVPGMFRYCMDNASSGDTIIFEVDSVGLMGEIQILYQSLVIDGGSGTIIDGGQNGRVFNISFDGMHNTIIKNLTIQNGYEADPSYAWGGGMYAFGSGQGLQVENCKFINNTAFTDDGDGQGGALRTQGGTFVNCFFINNNVSGNGLSNSGGAIMSIGGTFINCVIAGNNAKYGGGAYATNASSFLNCTFTLNTTAATGNGAGISCEETSTFKNCIIYNNTSAGNEDNVDDNGGVFSFSAFESGNTLTGINNNIALDSSPFMHTGNDSLSIHENSICLDNGDPFYTNYPEHDIIGHSRISGNRIDIGAYEFFIPVEISGKVVKDDGSVLADFSIHENITTDADGMFLIIENTQFKKNDIITLNAAPDGYEFYPKQIVIDENKTVTITAYTGIVVDEEYPVGSHVEWNADSVHVFVDVKLDSSSLNVHPGTTVKFHNYNGIYITGTGSITARGSFDQPIVFTAADTSGFVFKSSTNVTGTWHGIRFKEMTDADSSIFEHCTIQFGKASLKKGYGEPEYGGAISVYSFSKPFYKLLLKQCKLINNCAHGTNAKGGAIALQGGEATLINCEVRKNKVGGSNNFGGAIYLSSATITIINSNIEQCGIESDYIYAKGGGIYLYNWGCKVNLVNSILRDNYVNNTPNQIDHTDDVAINVYNCQIENTNTFIPSIMRNTIGTDQEPVNMGTLDHFSDLIPQKDIYGNDRIHQTYIDIGMEEKQTDIITNISGRVSYENNMPISNFSIAPQITTDENGYFSIIAGENGVNEGDTIDLSAPEGYEFYPGKIIVGTNRTKKINPIAYPGIVIDEFYRLQDSMQWIEDTINIFTDIRVIDRTLIIDPGVVIRFHKYNFLTVERKGKIIARGTRNDTIKFTVGDTSGYSSATNSTKGAWKGIRFESMNIYADSSLFEYCKIEHAKNFSNGGGIYIRNFTNLLIKNSEIVNNCSNSGGGIYLRDAGISIINCNIHHNFYLEPISSSSTTTGGGGINLFYSDAKIIGCNIHNNKTYRNGAGILAYGSSPIIYNCNIVYNSNPYEYDIEDINGLYSQSSDITIYNSIIWGNQGKQILSASKSWMTPSSIHIYNSCLEGGNDFNAEIYKNCSFNDPNFIDTTQYNFQLQNGSVYINSGIDTLDTLLPSVDMNDSPRILGSQIDIGAFEFKEITLMIGAKNREKIGQPLSFQSEVFMGTADSWKWDFNNDELIDSEISRPQYTFQDTGYYRIMLIAHIEELDRMDTAWHTIQIVNDPPIAGFKADTLTGTVPLVVQFTEESSGPITSWLWDFGDGNTSTEQNPKHEYSESGNYTVSLYLSGPYGNDTLIKPYYIFVSELDAVKKYFEHQISIYPNPAEHELNISTNQPYTIKIFNSSGTLISQKKLKGNYERINLSEYTNGLYILYLYNKDQCIIRKFMKQ